MNNNNLFDRMLAEDVLTAELRPEYNKEKKIVRKIQHVKDVMEQYAESAWTRIYGQKSLAA